MCIHESGDLAAACRFWLEVTKASPKQFNKVSLKRHNPRTARKNIGEGYHGCLRITAHRSSDLYRKIEGWAAAAMIGPECLAPDRRDRYPGTCSGARR